MQRWRLFIYKKLWIFPVIAILILIPLATSWYLIHKASELNFQTPVQVWNNLPTPASEITTQTGLMLSWESEVGLLAPQWQGTVQKIYISAGDQIILGTRIAKIDGVDRIAAVQDEPFYRPLAFGDSGNDVVALNSLLNELGFTSEDDDTFGYQTSDGVAQLASYLGAHSRISVFDPSWIVFSDREFIAESIDFQQAAPAPPPGAQIVQGKPRLTSASTVSVMDARALSENAGNPSSANEISRVDIDDSETLTLNGQQLHLSPDSNSEVSTDSFALIESSVTPSANSTLALVSKTEVGNVYELPNSAIFLDDSSKLCVIVRRNDTVVPVEVEISSTTDALTTLIGDFMRGDEIALVPALENTKCR